MEDVKACFWRHMDWKYIGFPDNGQMALGER